VPTIVSTLQCGSKAQILDLPEKISWTNTLAFLIRAGNDEEKNYLTFKTGLHYSKNCDKLVHFIEQKRIFVFLRPASLERFLPRREHALHDHGPGVNAGNTKGGRIIVPLTSCLTGLDWSVFQKKLSAVIQLIPNQSNWKSVVQ
jgi:hypothetical protein